MAAKKVPINFLSEIENSRELHKSSFATVEDTLKIAEKLELQSGLIDLNDYVDPNWTDTSDMDSLNVEEIFDETISISHSYPDVNTEYVASVADYMLIGTITGLHPIAAYDAEDGINYVHTEVTMNIDRDLCNNYHEPEIMFMILGGELDGRKTLDEDMPSFTIGDRDLVLLKEGTSGIGYFGAQVYLPSPLSLYQFSNNNGTLTNGLGHNSGNTNSTIGTMMSVCSTQEP